MRDGEDLADRIAEGGRIKLLQSREAGWRVIEGICDGSLS
jgi:hypothetical protein